MMHERLPIGWFDLVHDLRLALMQHFPSVAVTEMSSDCGWLHVRVNDSGLDPAEHLRLHRMVQGYVTQSLTICMLCGSHHGLDRGERRKVTCNECELETCDADA